ncbi:MAG: class I SAM-dependent methyltransferase [Pseudomonadota bacterium]
MSKDPDLDAAYGLSGPQSVKELYASWAETYDASFAASQGYDLHRQVAAHFVRAGGRGPVLDVGAGTGLVGEALAALGIKDIEGTDLSPEMLAVAEAKGCYSRCFAADITQPLDIPNDTYAGVTSAGTFTLGHLGPAPLEELIRITRPDGLFAITVNAAHWEAAEFQAAFVALGDKIKDLQKAEVGIYAAGAEHDHAGDRGFVVTFRVT